MNPSQQQGKPDENIRLRRERIRKALLEKARERFNELQKKSNENNNLDRQQSEIPTNSTTFSSSYLAPISPTPQDHITTALPKLNLNPKSLLIDIGCGDGRWLIESCLATKCRSVGVDVDPDRLSKARANIERHSLIEKISLYRQDGLDFMRNSSLILQANTIVVYLFRDAMMEVSNILRDRLIGNSAKLLGDVDTSDASQQVQILSIGFKLPGFVISWHQSLAGLSIYLYQIPKSNNQANSFEEQR